MIVNDEELDPTIVADPTNNSSIPDTWSCDISKDRPCTRSVAYLRDMVNEKLSEFVPSLPPRSASKRKAQDEDS